MDDNVRFDCLEDVAHDGGIGEIAHVICDFVEATQRGPEIEGVEARTAVLREELKDLAGQSAAASGYEDSA